MNQIPKNSIQSIIFKRSEWYIVDAEFWLYRHNYKPIKPVDITTHYYRFRLREPIQGATYRIIDFGKGIKAVYMILHPIIEKPVIIPEYTSEYENEQIRKWLKANPTNFDEYF